MSGANDNLRASQEIQPQVNRSQGRDTVYPESIADRAPFKFDDMSVEVEEIAWKMQLSSTESIVKAQISIAQSSALALPPSTVKGADGRRHRDLRF